MLKGLNLSDEQKAKVEELRKEYGPKFKESWQKMDGILTAEQKKARQEAAKAAKAAGKKRDEVWKEAQAAAKITDEQKAKMAECGKAAGALHKEAREKVMATFDAGAKGEGERDAKALEGAQAGRQVTAADGCRLRFCAGANPQGPVSRARPAPAFPV